MIELKKTYWWIKKKVELSYVLAFQFLILARKIGWIFVNYSNFVVIALIVLNQYNFTKPSNKFFFLTPQDSLA
jgi:hypothetical protein